MKKYLFLMASALLLLGSCSSVPVTGRRQLNIVSDNEVLSSSLTEYQSYMKTAKKSTNATETAQVERVGKRIAAATEAYLKSHGGESEIKNFSWEFNLVQNNELNAFCMPGGKIVVYEGLMNIISKDDELAVVLGHEVAHAVAKHSNERMSQQVLAQYGAGILGQALSGKKCGSAANSRTSLRTWSQLRCHSSFLAQTRKRSRQHRSRLHASCGLQSRSGNRLLEKNVLIIHFERT